MSGWILNAKATTTASWTSFDERQNKHPMQTGREIDVDVPYAAPEHAMSSASTPIGDAHLRLAYRADETDWTALEAERKRRERRTRGQSEETEDDE